MEITKGVDTVSKPTWQKRLGAYIIENIVMIIFVVICIAGVILAKQSAYYLISQLLERISRNTFLVLALIIPVVAGMGLNFSIIIGAMAGQIAVIIAANFKLGGVPGMILVMLLAVPFSIIFGIMIGKLLNKTRGQEMIASMIVGFFANGLYQFLFLFLVGLVIPIANKELVLQSGIGMRNTVDMAGIISANSEGLTTDGLKYAIDSIWKMRIFNIVFIYGLMMTTFNLLILNNKAIIALLKLKEGGVLRLILDPVIVKKRQYYLNRVIGFGLVTVASFAIHYLHVGTTELKMISTLKFPMVTAILIMLLALFNVIIQKTKLGQDFRSVGQDQHVAKVSGIDVDKIRVIAITISTVFAAWGQIIMLQNVGVLNTFGSHMQIGMFSVAAILVGGASVTRATNKQAIIGVILFHTLFIVSPTAGKNLFGDPQIGEFFRAFVAYGVIGLSLGLYAWKRAMGKKV